MWLNFLVVPAVEHLVGRTCVVKHLMIVKEASHGVLGHVKAKVSIHTVLVLKEGSGINDRHARMRLQSHLESHLWRK